ncbi:MAG TPA: alpha/beta fold hydrolase [Gemmatimonadaceae bacterium]
MTVTLIALVLLAAAFAVARGVRAWWVARGVALRLPVGVNGIIEGAEPIVRERSGAREAVLLLHGFGDTPQTLVYLADELHARGWDVHAPLLPGHGRTLRSFASSRSQQWVGAAREALDYLLARYQRVAIVGLSMGGALAAILAAERDRVVALALLAPYVELPPRLRRLVRHHQLIHVLTPVLRGNTERSILDPAERARSLGYRAMTPTLARELAIVAERARMALPRIRVPTLLAQSRQDNRLATAVADRAFAALGARDKELMWLEGAGHVITVDYGREQLLDAVATWLRRWADAGGASPYEPDIPTPPQ